MANILLSFQMTVHRVPPIIRSAALFDTDVYKLLHTPDDRAPSFVHKVGNHLYEEHPFISRISSLWFLYSVVINQGKKGRVSLDDVSLSSFKKSIKSWCSDIGGF